MPSFSEFRAFSSRLTLALGVKGVAARPRALAKLFNGAAASTNVTEAATRKWLRGEAIPTQDKIQVLAALLDVSPTWLRFGHGPVTVDAHSTELSDEEWTLVRAYRLLDEQRRKAVLSSLLQG
ncbi:helix-turn-helix domain-containing protein [Noviherbaspirillum galbum]|uniref:Helix-turn-helix domain-containing protein n=1 Tax=Noviherbaspirillum galbum TaxID=2709383 RepID=A0A6B3SSJ9_9BURK|nr:helix-turn-helix domain-containing protein [Noviherbaspirillum galbum]NEX63438.1 helix-turn-helix domain-containing protein [Noviherbaspirillum galbum]